MLFFELFPRQFRQCCGARRGERLYIALLKLED
jgi:hypothetical protein